MNNRLCILLMAVLAAISFIGCADDDHDTIPPSTVITHILSDQNADGDIALSLDGTTLTVTQAVNSQNVLAGIDPDFGDEFRGFLDFPLGGADGVPSGAAVVEATLEVFINSFTAAPGVSEIPLLVDLVSFQPPLPLVGDDFFTESQPPLLTMGFQFFLRDAGLLVAFDVTPLMQEAQRLDLPDFQIRLRTDFSTYSGDALIEIDDGAPETAPLLTVEYY
ncbi:MAG: hypothetical protein ACOZF0_05930 [Thermodesulfobacteriota bacterium]